MKKVSLILTAVVMTAMMLSFSGCGALTEEGATTEEVTIGEQVWMAKNLNVDKFRNGDPILEAKTRAEWTEANNNKVPAWCYHDNNPENGDLYGKLYNWYAVSDPRGLAPKGWKIPFDEDWTRLTDYLGGNKEAGKKMKSTSGWRIEGDYYLSEIGEGSGNGTNESGFSGLPGGRRWAPPDADFVRIGEDGYWWSSTEKTDTRRGTDNAWYRNLDVRDGEVEKRSYTKGAGLSVRCLRD